MEVGPQKIYVSGVGGGGEPGIAMVVAQPAVVLRFQPLGPELHRTGPWG
jgi:hypothetical protein